MADQELVRLATPVTDRDHVRGPADAPATLVEYGDFECPYCRAAVPIVAELERVLGDRLRFVFRHFPLTHRHPNAQRAAEASEAAAAQGKFFEMHDLLFANQDALERADLGRYARELDLDIPRFDRELDRHAYTVRVEEDAQDGLDSGVGGTPTFFLDGLRYDGLVGVRQMLAAIDAAHPGLVDDAVDDELERKVIPRVVRQRSSLDS